MVIEQIITLFRRTQYITSIGLFYNNVREASSLLLQDILLKLNKRYRENNMNMFHLLPKLVGFSRIQYIPELGGLQE